MEEENNFSIKKMWKITNPSKIHFISGLVLSIVSSVISLIIPLLIKDIMDELSKGISFGLISQISILLILEIIFSAFSLYLLSKVGEEIVKNLRDKLWEKFLKLPVKYYNDNKSGEMVSRITSDTTAIVNIISSEIVDLITSCITLILSLIILFTLDVPMTLVLILVVPITLFIVIPLGEKVYDLSFQEQNKMSQLTAYLSQTLSEIKLVKSYNTELKEAENGKKHFEFLYNNGIKRAKINSILTPVLGTFTTLVLIGVIGFGAWRVDQGLISSGELVAFLLYLFQIMSPFIQMNHFLTSFQEAKGSMKRLFDILEEEEEIQVVTKTCIESPTQLEFKDVYFRYDEKENVIEDISFKIKKGSLTALVGPSGSGKSTIFSLIERFYDPTNGDILLDDVSYKNIHVEEWRQKFSYVSQDTPIFSGTIRDNILYGKNDKVTDDKLIEIATFANAHEFIVDLSDGYNTQVGERGNQLSGGQKQRIAIARALMRDADFLLLDEATANLDSDSEKQVQKAINTLIHKQTTFVIAHRLSTIVDADQIIVLEDGRITGFGTHDELLSNHEYYQKVIKQQFERQ
ncbi:TPA: ABC transporter ATP-binding protein [Bacillus toyonensis]|uniref:ABC transporter ATP-binding protein n=1 Tax=Bacillus TaxID=1386 RepID=UPI0018F738A9|nr:MULTISPECIES: ABC transporter ATP-binding protein [Bacillus]MBJ8044561.1 ABC transporter ATP-binding protein [Bacillus cereus group sp. N17]MBJ8068125.1 ABC transporter ATP-binding protein [Bacillus cereus group sp. N15]MCS3600768.1 ATP-binding cassette subfamily B protein AbcA/BmrA [Bacillus sp. JUb91]HDR7449685.1 ABC transporter ATP-binding protein [Bacillus toyonensis]